jgi:glyceraldehyde-3-phosphate dehydrogenase/erythrose-4-phosphate dehydrogenase
MTVRVGINGFGRIGRNHLRADDGTTPVQVVAINDIAPAATPAHLLAYDFTYAKRARSVEADGDKIVVDGVPIAVSTHRDSARPAPSGSSCPNGSAPWTASRSASPSRTARSPTWPCSRAANPTPRVNAAFETAAEGALRGIAWVTHAPIVSRDVIGDPYPCVVDAEPTQVNGDPVKVFGWHDNEWGYTNRLLDLTEYVARRL